MCFMVVLCFGWLPFRFFFFFFFETSKEYIGFRCEFTKLHVIDLITAPGSNRHLNFIQFIQIGIQSLYVIAWVAAVGSERLLGFREVIWRRRDKGAVCRYMWRSADFL